MGIWFDRREEDSEAENGGKDSGLRFDVLPVAG